MNVKNEDNIYFTADLHLGPSCFRVLSQRGFGSNWQAHLEYVKQQINSVVSKNDILFILGDIGIKDVKLLESFFKQINGIKYITIGNHDCEKSLNILKEKGVIADVKESFKFTYRNTRFHLHHEPLMEWWGFYRNGFHCFGHCHGRLPEKPYRMMDVGIDAIGYRPIHIKEVISTLENKRNINRNGKRIEE